MAAQTIATFTCRLCGRTSANAVDLAMRFCGACNRLEEPGDPTVRAGSRLLIRTDGTIERLDKPLSSSAIRGLIEPREMLATVNLRHLGEPLTVMMVDDTGVADGKPVNRIASSLYWRNCLPGTTHEIRGDVVIVPDSDFAPPQPARAWPIP